MDYSNYKIYNLHEMYEKYLKGNIFDLFMISMVFYKLPKSSFITMFGILLFLVCSTIAMFFYPGGTTLDANVEGYSFFLNKLSDLGMFISYSGEPNWIAFFLFNGSLFLLGISLIPFILSLSEYLRKNYNITPKMVKFMNILGCTAGFGFSLVGLNPKDLEWAVIMHSAFQYLAFVMVLAYQIFTAKLIQNSSYPKKFALIYYISAFLQFVYLFFLFHIIPLTKYMDVVSQKLIVYIQLIAFFIEILGFLHIAKNNK